MEQHEYARLVEYSLHNEPLSASTYYREPPVFRLCATDGE